MPRAPRTHLRNELADADARRALRVTPPDHLTNTLLDLSTVFTRHTPAMSRVCCTLASGGAPAAPAVRPRSLCSARRAPPCACPDSLALCEDHHRRETRRLHERHDVLCAGRAAAHERARRRRGHSKHRKPLHGSSSCRLVKKPIEGKERVETPRRAAPPTMRPSARGALALAVAVLVLSATGTCGPSAGHGAFAVPQRPPRVHPRPARCAARPRPLCATTASPPDGRAVRPEEATEQARRGPLDGYASQFQVSAAARVVHSGHRGLGLRAARDIGAHQPIVTCHRRGVLEVSEDAACPWTEEQMATGVQRSDVESVWQALPLDTKLALVLLDTADAAEVDRKNVETDARVAEEEAAGAAEQDPLKLWEDTKQWVHHLRVLRKPPSMQSFLENDLRISEPQFEEWLRCLLAEPEHACTPTPVHPHKHPHTLTAAPDEFHTFVPHAVATSRRRQLCGLV